MSYDPKKRRPDGVVVLDVGCFRQKTPREMEEEADPKNLEARIKRILESKPPKPPV